MFMQFSVSQVQVGRAAARDRLPADGVRAVHGRAVLRESGVRSFQSSFFVLYLNQIAQKQGLIQLVEQSQLQKSMLKK